MSDPATCPHNGLYWYAAPADEQGWKCVDCDWKPGEPPGFSPKHDRSHIATKVGCVLHDLHEAGIIYVSNGSGGDALTEIVARRCVSLNVYDSVAIARFILEIEGDDRHATFWRDISIGILAGKDPRHRCACGKLATQTQIGGGATLHACSAECMAIAEKRSKWKHRRARR